MLKESCWLAVAIFFISVPARSQEWAKALNDLMSTDQTISAAARERVFKVMLPRLQTEDAASASKEAVELGALSTSPDQGIRIQASGVLGTIATIRQDSAEVLQPALPALLGYLRDQVPRVRENAASALANMKPAVQNQALRPLIGSLQDQDVRVASTAALGLARFGDSSPEAMQALSTVFDGTGRADVKRAVVQAMAALHLTKNPTLLGGVGKALNDGDRGVVRDTLQAIQMMGPEVAAKFRDRIEVLAKDSSDSEISGAATAVLNNLSRRQ